MYTNVEDAMRELSEWKLVIREKVSPLIRHKVYKPTFTADCYHEAALYRFIELAEATFNLYKSNLLVAAIVTARSAQETLAILWYLNSKLKSFSRTRDLDQLDKTLRRLMIGWAGDAEFPEKINVLNAIDAVDKVLGGKFRRHYNQLSEYAHPNYSGTFGAYAQPNHGTFEVTFGSYPRSQEELKALVESTLIILVTLLHSIQEDYELEVNKALKICYELQ